MLSKEENGKAPDAYSTGGFLYYAVRRYNDC